MVKTRRGNSTLTVKQAKFVDELLANGGNRAAAYRRAFPDAKSESGIRAAATLLGRHPGVVKALTAAQAAAELAMSDAVARYAITAERVADEMARLAFTRLDQVASVRTELGADGKRRQLVEVRDFGDIDGQALSALVKVKRSAGGEVSVELADKLAALNSLARLKGWIADKPAPTGNLVMLRVER